MGDRHRAEEPRHQAIDDVCDDGFDAIEDEAAEQWDAHDQGNRVTALPCRAQGVELRRLDQHGNDDRADAEQDDRQLHLPRSDGEAEEHERAEHDRPQHDHAVRCLVVEPAETSDARAVHVTEMADRERDRVESLTVQTETGL